MKTIKQILSGLVAIGFLLLSASTANSTSGRPVCGPRDQALRQLEGKHSESVLGRGLAPGGKAMLELFVSKSGTWTVLMSHPNGRSCVMASGASWHQLQSLQGQPA